MRLKRTRLLKQGEVLAQSIRNERGLILIQKDMQLTTTMIKRLIDQGVTYVYVIDRAVDAVECDPILSHDLRVGAINTIRDTFSELKGVSAIEKCYILEQKGNELHTVVQDIVTEMKHREEAVSLLTDILISDDYTFQHSLNVAIYSLAIGTKLKLREEELTHLGIGAMLHDIGKIFIDKEILQKAGQLTDEEFEIMKTHAELGFDFLRKMTDLPSVIAHCAYQHHERLDGSGYPRGMKGNDIHKYAKIIGIADVFDAVTSNRVYREAMLPHVGLEILYAGAVNMFELEMIEAFKSSIIAYPTGLTVRLSDNRAGVVVKQNRHVCDRPVVEVTHDGDTELQTTHKVDLSETLNLMIVECYTN